MDTNKLLMLLPDLAVFALVVESGSFSATARQLGVSPSAVSRQMSCLEQALNVKLLERTTRSLKPSTAGKTSYEFCKNVLDSARSATAAASASAEASGELRIAAPKAYARHVLEPLIAPFLGRYPKIQLRFKVSDFATHPLRDEVDIVFRPTDHPDENLIAKVVGQIESILCASPSYLVAHGEPMHPYDLLQHACIDLGETAADRDWLFQQAGQTLKVAVMGRYSVNHSEMRLNAAKQGFGIALLPDFMANPALAEGSLQRVLSTWRLGGNYQGTMVMQFAAHRYRPAAVRVFVDYISAELNLRAEEQAE